MFKKKRAQSQPDQASRNPRLGSQNPTVFSYHSNRSQRVDAPQDRGAQKNVSEVATKKRSRRPGIIGNLPILLSVLAVALAIIFISTLQTDARVVSLSTSNGKPIRDFSQYQSGASEILSSSIMNRSKLTIDADKVTATLQERFPEIKNATLTIPLLGRRPVIEIELGTPALLVATNTGVYVVDSDGRALFRASELNSSIRDSLPTIRDDATAEVTPGKQILPKDLVQFIQTVSAQLGASGIEVEQWSLPLPNELHVKPKDSSYYVKFNIGEDPRQQIGTYLAIREKLAADRVVPKEYIDVRVLDRGYYR